MPKFLILIWLWALLPFSQGDVQQFTELQRLGNGALGDVAFSPYGTQVAVGTSLGVTLYDISGDTLVELPQHHPAGSSRLVWSHNGEWLAIEDRWLLGNIPPRPYNTLTLWEISSGNTVELPLETPSLDTIIFSPDDTKVAVSTLSTPPAVNIYEVASGELLHSLYDPVMDSALVMQHFSIAFSPDSSRIATSGSEVLIWDLETGEIEKRLSAEPDACLFWSEAGLFTNWKTVTLWDVENAAPLNTTNGSHECEKFTDGRHVISESTDSYVSVFDLAENQEVYRLPVAGRSGTQFAGDLLLTHIEQAAQVWDGETLINETTVPVENFGLSIFYGTLLDWSPDGRWAAIKNRADAGLEELLLWNVETDANAGDFPQFTERLVGVRWFEPDSVWVDGTSDGHQFASYSWDLVAGELSGTSAAIGEWGGETLDPEIVSTIMSDDGLHTITIDIHGIVRVYDTAAPDTPLLEIEADQAYSAALSLDGQYLAVGGDDIRIWDAETGDLLTTLEGHLGAVTDLTWSFENDRLASVGADGITIIWGLPKID